MLDAFFNGAAVCNITGIDDDALHCWNIKAIFTNRLKHAPLSIAPLNPEFHRTLHHAFFNQFFELGLHRFNIITMNHIKLAEADHVVRLITQQMSH